MSTDARRAEPDAHRGSGDHGANCARIPGVAQATVVGGVDRELTVEIKPRAPCRRAASASAQVVQALQAQNLAAPVGAIERGAATSAPSACGASSRRRGLSCSLVVDRSAAGRLIRLGEVADVIGTASPKQRTAALYNGRDAVGLHGQEVEGLQHHRRWRRSSVAQVDGAPADAAAGDEARGRPGLPAIRVKAPVENVQDALIEGALLTVLVVFLFLNSWRSTVITGLALPVSVLARVHRGVGVRLHAQHDVAARSLARDRHPDRRRDRGAREHRAARRDGEGPLTGRRTRAPTRSASP